MKQKPILYKHQQQLGSLGMLLREYRLSEGVTQSELCESINVCRKTISRLETGKNTNLLTILEIAKYLGIDVLNELFG